MPPKTDYVALVANLMTIVISVSALFYAAKRYFYDRKLDARRAWIWYLAKDRDDVPFGFRVLVVLGFLKPLQNVIVNKSKATAQGGSGSAGGNSSLETIPIRTRSGISLDCSEYAEMIRHTDWLDRISDRHDVITGNDEDEYFLELLRLWVNSRTNKSDGNESENQVSKFLQKFSSMVEEKPHWFTIKAKFAPKPTNYASGNQPSQKLVLQTSTLPWSDIHEALLIVRYFSKRLEQSNGKWPINFDLLGHLCEVSPNDARTCVHWLAYAHCTLGIDLNECTVKEGGIVITDNADQEVFAAQSYQSKLKRIRDFYSNDHNKWNLLAQILLTPVENTQLLKRVNDYSAASPNDFDVLKELYNALAKQIELCDGPQTYTSQRFMQWAKAKLLCAEQIYYSANALIKKDSETTSDVVSEDKPAYVRDINKTLTDVKSKIDDKNSDHTELCAMHNLLVKLQLAERWVGDDELKEINGLVGTKIDEYELSLALLNATIAINDYNECKDKEELEKNEGHLTECSNDLIELKSREWDVPKVELLIETAIADIELCKSKTKDEIVQPINCLTKALAKFDGRRTGLEEIFWSQEHQYARAMLAFLKVLENRDVPGRKVTLRSGTMSLEFQVPTEVAYLFTAVRICQHRLKIPHFIG